MGALDQETFERLIRSRCAACAGATFEIRSFIDRSTVVMLSEPNDAGRWVHDGEKFVDGTYRISCASCASVTWTSEVCPRCNRDGALAETLATASRLTIPKRCPTCSELELLAVALVPASATYGTGNTPKPQPLVEHGEPGYHVVAYACPSCDNAVVAEGCPLCAAPGPLRPRP